MRELRITVSLIPAERGQDLTLTLPPAAVAALLTSTGPNAGSSAEPLEKDLVDGTPVEGEASAPLHIQLHLQRHHAGKVEVTGHITTQWVLPCGRCLRPISWDLSHNVHTFFAPPTLRPTHEEIELQEEDLNIDFYQGDTLSLVDLVREVLLLEIPTYPLCREDCAGLCARCGRDLNEGPCGCPPQPGHLGLAALQERFKS